MSFLTQPLEVVLNKIYLLLSDSFEPLEHTQHYSHRDEAEAGKYSPAHPLLGECIEHCNTKGDEQVTDSGSRQPQTLAYTLQVLGSNLRHERQTEG